MKGLLSPPRRPQINSRSQPDARGGPGLPDVIRCARRKHARSIISSFLRDSGMHQARLFIPIVFLLYSLSFSVSAATLPSGFIETTVASGIASPTAMAIAPDGRIFVCSQSGALRVIKNGVLLASPFATLSVERGRSTSWVSVITCSITVWQSACVLLVAKSGNCVRINNTCFKPKL